MELADRLVDLLAEEDPLNELLDGYPGFEHRLPDLDEAEGLRLRDRARDIAQAAAKLDPQDRVTRGVVVQQAESLATRVDARLVEHTVADHVVSPAAVLLSRLPHAVPADPAHYLARLGAVPEFLAVAAERHRGGLAAGRLPVAHLVAAAIRRLDGYLADPVGDPLRRAPLSGRRAAAKRDRVLDERVRPAVVRYREMLRTELAPHGRPPDRPGLCWLPDGDATYAALVGMHTTTSDSQEDLHRTGLDLLERLSGEYLIIGAKALGARSFAEVQDRMRTDPALRFGGAEQVLAVNRAAMDRAEAAAPAWFGRLPRHRCRLAPTPELVAPTQSAASYQPGPLDGSRPGTYHVNTYRATERDRCIAEANAFHEAVPGHHVQISLAQELTGVPLLRKVAWVNAYMEGWALYCERLADEMGLYSDDVARLGMLANDSMRAARLVVDTGLHHFGWSRRQAVDFLRGNTVMSEVEIQSETDRYIEQPGQALSYMVGRLEFQRLRGLAERTLGTSFDVRSFHDLVLGVGPVPMAVLDDVVVRYVER
ncbi:MAG TPA: DUF885 domain-containing protein [Actinophytocola sp.]|uniref:DUF885 domain-containing protein n=1 Tax=Actinophytocola sp. TaxID=1872138 RepID=UPI002DDD66AE|nr:DUF885 domain-containing protein [Actinophytocola sp.]HEV2779136.1 DUF885 domain-containing protein [Actinophytocola sp.]